MCPNVKDRVQIVISHGPSPSGGTECGLTGRFGRLKVFLGGLLFAAAAVGVLVFVFLVGSIVAAIVWILLSATIVWLILRAMVRSISK